MKKVLGLLLIFICNGFQINGQNINFLDPNFKTALVNSNCIDTNGDFKADADADSNDDGEIQLSEAATVKNLYIFNKNIQSLKGIQNFISL